MKEKLQIADLLDQTGIPELEIGTPAMGSDEVADMRTIVKAVFSFKTLDWCRVTKKDIDAAIKTGVDRINISFPTSDIHQLALKKDHKWVLGTMQELVKYASGYFEFIAIGAQDASRANQHFLSDFILQTSVCGVHKDSDCKYRWSIKSVFDSQTRPESVQNSSEYGTRIPRS